jgi:hypothetical protein
VIFDQDVQVKEILIRKLAACIRKLMSSHLIDAQYKNEVKTALDRCVW